MTRRPFLLAVLVSPRLFPVVMALVLLGYVGICFVTDEALVTLVTQVRSRLVLQLLLALLPVSLAMRAWQELALRVRLRRLATEPAGTIPEGCFHEQASVPSRPVPADLLEPLRAAGYRAAPLASGWHVRRGVSLFPAHLLLRLAGAALLAGILLSVMFRSSSRMEFIEGEPIPPGAGSGRVEEIRLWKCQGLFMEKEVTVSVTNGNGTRSGYRLFPPSLREGRYIYLRYLGIAPLVRMTAPDLAGGFQGHFMLMIWPPGREDSVEIPGTRYRIAFTMAPGENADSYETGRITLQFTVKRGDEVVLTGRAPVGGEFRQGPFALAFPEFRRVVVADMVQDTGLQLIWFACCALLGACCWWAPVRLLAPRREIWLLQREDRLLVLSLAEGGIRRHAGLFHDLVDRLAPATDPLTEEADSH